MSTNKKCTVFKISGHPEMVRFSCTLIRFVACARAGDGLYCVVEFLRCLDEDVNFEVSNSTAGFKSENEAWDHHVTLKDSNKIGCRVKGMVFDLASSKWVITGKEITVKHVYSNNTQCSCRSAFDAHYAIMISKILTEENDKQLCRRFYGSKENVIK